MVDEIRFFKCNNCGNIITKLHDSGMGVSCCGERMQELVPSYSGGDAEKHRPLILQDENRVLIRVGKIEHPMVDSHHIKWICILSGHGVQIKYLNPADRPEAYFIIPIGDKVLAVYAFCNLHGLWKG